MSLTIDQIRKYYESRLDGQRLSATVEVSARCPFHDDGNPSLGINMEKGAWNCYAGCGGGGMVSFEMKLNKCDETTARAAIAKLLGISFSTGQQPEQIYKYVDADGRLLFEKLRMPGKRFMQRKPNANGGFDYKLGDVQKPLYRLPELLVANEIFICEGEKDADNVSALNLSNRERGIFVAATTNFDGAGKWRAEYAPFFAGKRVVILPDNDEIGRTHAQQVARSVYPYAAGVKVVELPGLTDKGDVSDFLKDHSAAELVEQVNRAAIWKPSESASSLLVSAPEFVATATPEIDWLVDGIIERGANGFFCAVPKGGKSWAAIDLAISLTMGVPWLGFNVPRPVRCALISREDNPSLTRWRLQHLFAGKRAPARADLIGDLYVNSRQQSDELMLDNAAQVQDLVDALKHKEIEFAIFDVFNVLHAADENDNTEMRAILRQLSQIQAQVGCGIGVVHHFNKAENGSMTQKLRGASAIAGWAEWLIGISMADEEMKIRRMEFELKADAPPDPIFYRIESGDGMARLELSQYQGSRQAVGNRAAALMAKQ